MSSVPAIDDDLSVTESATPPTAIDLLATQPMDISRLPRHLATPVERTSEPRRTNNPTDTQPRSTR